MSFLNPGSPSMTVHRVLALALILSAAAAADQDAYVFPAKDRFVFPVTLGKALLHPCSRSVPKSIDAFWEPTEADIDNMDKQLLDYMTGLQRAQLVGPPAEPYGGQYIGIVVRGKKLIYGNFFPPSYSHFSADHQPIDICHGGPKLWGVVFHPKTNSFTDLSFNGPGG